jgi:hypothetical protein
MEFREWLALEGFMRIPYQVYRNMSHFVLRSAAESSLKGHPKAPETFPLDLRGTSHEFLQEMNPRVKITMHRGRIQGAKESVKGMYKGILKIGTKYILGDIHLIDDPSVAHEFLGHEILHFLQDLTRLWLQKKHSQSGRNLAGPRISDSMPDQLRSKIESGLRMSRVNPGGLPKKRVLRGLLRTQNVYGNTESDDFKEPEEGKYMDKPTEQMPWLFTIMNILRANYMMEVLKSMGVSAHRTNWEGLESNAEFAERMNNSSAKRAAAEELLSKFLEEFDIERRRAVYGEVYKHFVSSSDWARETFEQIGDSSAYADHVFMRRLTPHLRSKGVPRLRTRQSQKRRR